MLAPTHDSRIELSRSGGRPYLRPLMRPGVDPNSRGRPVSGAEGRLLPASSRLALAFIQAAGPPARSLSSPYAVTRFISVPHSLSLCSDRSKPRLSRPTRDRGLALGGRRGDDRQHRGPLIGYHYRSGRSSASSATPRALRRSAEVTKSMNARSLAGSKGAGGRTRLSAPEAIS